MTVGRAAGSGARRADLLVVDDDPAILTALERALRLEGFAVRTASGGRAALRAVETSVPDIIVLDVNMPDLDGIAVARRLREDGQAVPICMLSARDEVEDRVKGLEVGADDYLIKPFALTELIARLRALLRRRPALAQQVFEVGELIVDSDRRAARRGERELQLTYREFELLQALAANAGRVLSRDQLLSLVWGYDFETESNVVDVFVGYLRRKLEAGGEPRMLHTVRGAGFALRP